MKAEIRNPRGESWKPEARSQKPEAGGHSSLRPHLSGFGHFTLRAHIEALAVVSMVNLLPPSLATAIALINRRGFYSRENYEGGGNSPDRGRLKAKLRERGGSPGPGRNQSLACTFFCGPPPSQAKGKPRTQPESIWVSDPLAYAKNNFESVLTLQIQTLSTFFYALETRS